jgi:sialic acid synthase SpsE
MTLIIAEIGSNWTCKQDIFDSITAAKDAGADCAKLQLYSHKELYGYDGPVMPGEIPRTWIPEFSLHCNRVGIEFMCTAFSPDGYRFIDPFVKRHNIASAENTDMHILETIKSLRKPVLMSTGGSSIEDIRRSLCTLDMDHQDVTLMYCVSAYPAKNIQLDGILKIDTTFPHSKIGYSCHSSEWITPVYANSYADWGNAKSLDVVEKHFKIRDMNTPDSPHSILPEDFKYMVAALRQVVVYQHPDRQEADFIKYAKRRWIPELNGYYRTKNEHS